MTDHVQASGWHSSCIHECFKRHDAFVPDTDGGALDIQDDQRGLYSTIAYVCGLEDHPLRDHVQVVHTLEAALAATGTMAAPDQESTSEEEDRDNAVADSDDSHESEDPTGVPQYQVLEEDPEYTARSARLHASGDMLDEARQEPTTWTERSHIHRLRGHPGGHTSCPTRSTRHFDSTRGATHSRTSAIHPGDRGRHLTAEDQGRDSQGTAGTAEKEEATP